MRILVHDYGGHPFPVELSRALAGRGHRVHHAYAAGVQGPRGALARQAGDPATFTIAPVDLGEPLARTSFLRRRRQAARYGIIAAEVVTAFQPEVVLSGNTPPDAQARLQAAVLESGARFVFWVQDLFGEGVRRVLRRKLPIVGAPIARHYARLEQRLLERSDEVVLITEDFMGAIARERLRPDRLHVVPNWAPIRDLPVLPRSNDWSAEHGLEGALTFLYAGTLGLKHDPGLLLAVAEALREEPTARVVVVSEGAQVEWLRKRKAASGLANLTVLPFQPFERLAEMLASADVLLAILDPDAGVFSVPSKVLSYLCAGRPLLVAVPATNLAARVVTGNDAGVVVDSRDVGGFVREALALARDPGRRARLGANARAYAERTFDIDAIADRFEGILQERAGAQPSGPR